VAGGSEVTVEVGPDHVATVEMHRPPNNFFDVELIAALADTYEELQADGDCRAIVLCSEGRHFCAGADLTSGTERRVGDLYEEAIRLFAAELPVVAAVAGAAIGGGLGLALSADFRVGSPESRFAANFSRLGFHHGFGLSVTLPAAVGQQAAMTLLLTGRRIGGEEAFELGLVDRLAVSTEAVRVEAAALAQELAAAAPLAVRAIRATMREGLVDRLRAAVDREEANQHRLRQTEDFAEGVRASGERREPRFTGR
jgi:2-(1,2-epoxy-1,2-dihydrophenyl)acetyl-CoA isomerase